MKLEILQGDCLEVLKTLPDESVNCCVTSPPYFGLRDYGVPGQMGLETSPAEYIVKMVEVFSEVRRTLRADGTLWLNMGDSYANDGKWGGHTGGKHVKALHCSPIGRNKKYTGLKPKDLIGVPWMLAFALRDAGWYLRSDIIWAKPNPMPESVTDRPTKAHEYIFLMSKSAKYFYDAAAIAEPGAESSPARMLRAQGEHKMVNGANGQTPHSIHQPRPKVDKQCGHSRRHAGFNDRWDAMERAEQCSGMRNRRTVWDVATHPFPEAHFATFPPDLIEPCILAGCPEGGTVLDPFSGAGTTGLVSSRFGRNYIGIELNPAYVEMSRKRIEQDAPMFNRIETKVSAENSQESQSQIFGD